MRLIALLSERPVYWAFVGSLKQARAVVPAVIVLILSHGASLARAQSAPVSADHLWHGIGEKSIEAEAKNVIEPRFNFDPEKTYALSELIDLAESHNQDHSRQSRWNLSSVVWNSRNQKGSSQNA